MAGKATGTYTVRGVAREEYRAARLRATSEGTTLRAVMVQALRDYAAKTWTPRADAPAPRRNGV